MDNLTLITELSQRIDEKSAEVTKDKPKSLMDMTKKTGSLEILAWINKEITTIVQNYLILKRAELHSQGKE